MTWRIAPFWAHKTTQKHNCHIWRTLYLQEDGATTPSAHATSSSYILPKWWYREKQDSTSKWWEIISRSHMLYLPSNMTIYRKFPVINSQHPHWITFTTGGTQNDPNYKGCTNYQYSYPKLDFFGHILNHQFHQKQKSFPKHPTL